MKCAYFTLKKYCLCHVFLSYTLTWIWSRRLCIQTEVILQNISQTGISFPHKKQVHGKLVNREPYCRRWFRFGIVVTPFSWLSNTNTHSLFNLLKIPSTELFAYTRSLYRSFLRHHTRKCRRNLRYPHIIAHCPIFRLHQQCGFSTTTTIKRDQASRWT